MGRGYTPVDGTMQDYIRDAVGREHPALAGLREKTASMSNAGMQISPEQGQFIALLVNLTGARRYLEIGTFTGYSALAAALAMPEDGYLLACDVSDEYPAVGRPFWKEAGVTSKIDLRIGPALDTLEALPGDAKGTFDLAFIDADKENYPAYYEHSIALLRQGGMAMIDNVLWGGDVAVTANQTESTNAIRDVTRQVGADERVDCSLIPIGDGMLLARKR